jgi:hypothetical protein
MSEKIKGEVYFRNDKAHNSLTIVVPKGTTHAALAKVTLGDLISKFRPSGCGTCLSGQDFNIREKFEEVMAVEINAVAGAAAAK